MSHAADELRHGSCPAKGMPMKLWPNDMSRPISDERATSISLAIQIVRSLYRRRRDYEARGVTAAFIAFFDLSRENATTFHHDCTVAKKREIVT